MRRIRDNPDIKPADLKREFLFNCLIAILLISFTIIFSIIYSFMDALSVLGISFLVLVPSFLANGLMVITGKIKGIKRYTIDRGKSFKDGTRILGDGKSWNGFIGGWITGFLIGILISWYFFERIYLGTDYTMFPNPPRFISQSYVHSFINSIYNANGIVWSGYLLSQIFIALGSPLGDMLGSFLKRRFSKGRGEVFLFIDQNDFIIVSTAIASIWFPITWEYWIFLLLLTPLLTALANWVGFLMGKKDVPW